MRRDSRARARLAKALKNRDRRELAKMVPVPLYPLRAAPAEQARSSMSDMRDTVLSIRLDRDLDQKLSRLAARTGRGKSELGREALRRQVALAELERLRRRVAPLAEARGYLTDEDVFRDVS